MRSLKEFLREGRLGDCMMMVETGSVNRVGGKSGGRRGKGGS